MAQAAPKGHLRSDTTAKASAATRPIVVQDTEPSLEETRAWIAERMPELGEQRMELRIGGEVYVILTSLRTARLDPACVLHLGTETSGDKLGEHMTGPPSHWYSSTPLREVDGNGVHVQPSALNPASYVVQLPIAGGRKLIRDSSVSKGVTTEMAVYQVSARDEQSAQRIMRAIRRAVKLCGGRFEKF
jgi:hypothetical protein